MSFKNLKNQASKFSAKKAEGKAEKMAADRIATKVVKFEVALAHALQGVEFLVNKVVEVKEKVQGFQLQVIEKNPEFAKHYMDVGERVAGLQIAAGEKADGLMKEMYLGTVEAVFGSLNQVIAKTDITQVVLGIVSLAGRVQDRNDQRLALEKQESLARMDTERIQAEARVASEQKHAEFYARQAEYEKLRCEEKQAEMAERAKEREDRKKGRSIPHPEA